MTMMIATQAVSISHGETKPLTFTFPAKVRSAAVVLQGFNISFGNNDHHLRDLQVEVRNVNTSNQTVTADVQLKFIDGSNNKGSGTVQATAIADVESA